LNLRTEGEGGRGHHDLENAPCNLGFAKKAKATTGLYFTMRKYYIFILCILFLTSCTIPLGEYNSKHWVLTGKHVSVSSSLYRIKIYFKGDTPPDMTFKEYVMWRVRDTDYIKIKWEWRREGDGTGDLTLSGCIVYYKK
jgi:hypothetical protein